MPPPKAPTAHACAHSHPKSDLLNLASRASLGPEPGGGRQRHPPRSVAMDLPQALFREVGLDVEEISKRGEVIDVHNRVRMVTVGIASISPILPLPDVMLLARPITYIEDQAPREPKSKDKKPQSRPSDTLELTRLLPLKFVKISVHNREKQQLRLKLASGRSFYLQLCPSSDAREDLFSYWEKLIYLLRPPVEGYSSTHAMPAGDGVEVPDFMTKDKSPSQEPTLHSEGEQDQVSIKSLHMVPDVPSQEKMAEEEEIMAAAAGEDLSEKDLVTPLCTIQGIPSLSSPSIPSVQSIAVAAAASRGHATKAMAGTAPITGVALAGDQGPGLSIALTGSAAGQVTQSTSDGSVSLMLTGTVSKSPDSVSMVSADIASLTPLGHLSVISEEAESITVAGMGAITPIRPKSPFVSTLQNEGSMSQQDGSQKVALTSPKASKGGISTRRRFRHREGRGHKGAEKEGTGIQKRLARRVLTSKDSQKSSHRLLGSHRSPSSCKTASHSPPIKDSRGCHNPGKNTSPANTPSTDSAKKPSRIATFLHSFSCSSQSTRSTAVLTDVGDNWGTFKNSVSEMDMNTILENRESAGMDMKTCPEVIALVQAEGEPISLPMDSLGDTQGSMLT
ncbi:Golgi-associated RAB2B interactor protein 3-like isoform X2 [Macrotis lagotis]|uniref:Golgi-associated RAB2B interactor protein 3-like isoform X2 n=1 Tax=Macrotis lagotis TaxID=92651 RepID=UPI003D68BC06